MVVRLPPTENVERVVGIENFTKTLRNFRRTCKAFYRPQNGKIKYMSTYFARQLGLTRLEESQSIPRLRTYHSLHLQSTETTEKKYNFIPTSKQKGTLVCSCLKIFTTLTLIHSLRMLLRLINCSHSNTSRTTVYRTTE